MGKAELLEEARELGIEGVDGNTFNRVIEEVIAEAKAANAASDLAIDEGLSSEELLEALSAAAPEIQEESSPVEDSSEPVFSIGQLKDYSEQLFGVGYHVLVGAQSAGCFPSDKATREQVRAGIERYLSTPVTNSEEG